MARRNPNFPFTAPPSPDPAPSEASEAVDLVNHPPHYQQGGVECIDAIQAMLGREGFIAYLRGTVVRYSWRLGLKGDAEDHARDSRKAEWYARRLAEVLEDNV